MNLEQILEKHFGYSEFRPLQKEIITSLINGHDTLAILPTGTGKSVCFQIPGIILGGLTIVVTPLIALMKNQVDELIKKGVHARYIASSLSNTELETIYRDLGENRIQFLYVSPERLQQKKFITLVKDSNISLIIIDEAHCIAEWGDYFRQPYKKIHSFVANLTSKPTIGAFTATATHSVRETIIQSLHLRNHHEHIHSSIRDNIEIHVTHCSNTFYQKINLLKILEKHKNDSGIIYASTRNNVEQLYLLLQQWNVWPEEHISFYHAGLDKKKKEEIQENYILNKTTLLIATNAFGMGINKDNVRFVIHYNVPSTLEQYYQEIGRAGRDRKYSYSYLLYNQENIQINLSFVQNIKNKVIQKKELENIKKILAFINTHHCRNNYLEKHFLGKSTTSHCNKLCDNCRSKNPEINTSISLSTSNEIMKMNIKRLLHIRKTLATNYSINSSEIITLQAITYIAMLQPVKEKEYLCIPGIGTGWIEKWYPHFKTWKENS